MTFGVVEQMTALMHCNAGEKLLTSHRGGGMPAWFIGNQG